MQVLCTKYHYVGQAWHKEVKLDICVAWKCEIHKNVQLKTLKGKDHFGDMLTGRDDIQTDLKKMEHGDVKCVYVVYDGD